MTHCTISFNVADYSDQPAANIRVDFSPISRTVSHVDGKIVVPNTISVTTDEAGFGQVVLAKSFRYSARFNTASPIKLVFASPDTDAADLISLSDIDVPSDTGSVIGSVAWADVTDKPATFPPDAHTHAYADLTGLPTLGTAAATDATDYATAAQGALADTAVQSSTVTHIEQLTQSAYDALGTPDANTIYIIVG